MVWKAGNKYLLSFFRQQRYRRSSAGTGHPEFWWPPALGPTACTLVSTLALGVSPAVRAAGQRGRDFCCKPLRAGRTSKIVNTELYSSSWRKNFFFFEL